MRGARITWGDYLGEALFGNGSVFRCDDCGLNTGELRGPLHWVVWVAHDFTLGLGRLHRSHYGWDTE